MKALRRVLPYYRPYAFATLLGLALVICSSGVASVVPWVLREGVDRISAGGGLAGAWGPAALMIGLAVTSGCFRYGMRELLNSVSRRIEYNLRNDLFEHLERLDATYYGGVRTGDLMARLTNDLSAVRMAVGPAVMYLTNTIAGGVFAIAFMLRIDVQLTTLALLPMALLPVAMARLGTAIHQRFESVQEYFSALTTQAQEHLAGVRIVRAFRQESPEIARFAAMNEDYLERNMRLVRLWGLTNPAFSLLAGLGAVVVLGLGGSLVMQGTVSTGAFVAFGFYLSMLTWPLISLGWVTNLFQRGAASMARLNEILDARSAIEVAKTPRRLAREQGGPAIEFRDVGFAYPSPQKGPQAPRWVLRHISFSIPGGTTLGVAGATGSGKTALVELLPRLYDPQEGAILIDGVPIREMPVDALRAMIGFVPQENLVFSDTISANLAYGAPHTEDGGWGAQVADLDTTIAAFPEGAETLLGERGINLSGGQKQRVALARALARRPTILLLDDALSAVDTETEARILARLREALAGRTAVIASHRASALRDAGWIIVLDEGRIVEQGSHDTLLALRGRYWSLVHRQQLLEALEGEPRSAPRSGTAVSP